MSILSKRVRTLLSKRPSEEQCLELKGRGVKRADCDNAMLVAAALLDKAAAKDIAAIKEINALCSEDLPPADTHLNINIVDV